jgi:hypothetical protein
MSETVYVQYDSRSGDYILPLPEKMCADLGWSTGDTLVWTIKDDGTIMLSKKEPKYFMVDAVSSFRMRYVVEADCAEHAADVVTMKQASEFSQDHMDEMIASVRQVDEAEILRQCDVDNVYASSWTNKHKLDVFVTRKEDYE